MALTNQKAWKKSAKLNNAHDNAEHVKTERAKGNTVVRAEAQEMFNIQQVRRCNA